MYFVDLFQCVYRQVQAVVVEVDMMDGVLAYILEDWSDDNLAWNFKFSDSVIYIKTTIQTSLPLFYD